MALDKQLYRLEDTRAGLRRPVNESGDAADRVPGTEPQENIELPNGVDFS